MTYVGCPPARYRGLLVPMLCGLCTLAHAASLNTRLQHINDQVANAHYRGIVVDQPANPIVAVTDGGVTRNASTVPNVEAKYMVLGQVVGDSARLVRSTGQMQRYVLPVVLTSEAAGAVKTFHPVVDLTQKGMRYSAADKLFRATAVIWLQDDEGTGVHIDLPHPVGFLVSAPVDTIDPQQLEIGHINQPYQVVSLTVATPRDDMTLDVKTSFGNQTISVPLPVTRPAIGISAAPTSILAFGLESATITVEALDPGLQGLPSIVLSNDRGRLEFPLVPLVPANTGSTKLFSTALGTATITSESFPAAIVTPAQVNFRFPTAFTLALILGGALGGFVGRKRSLTALARGIAAGLLIGVLYVLGINVFKFTLNTPLASEAAGFVLAALGPSSDRNSSNSSIKGARNSPRDGQWLRVRAAGRVQPARQSARLARSAGGARDEGASGVGGGGRSVGRGHRSRLARTCVHG